MLVPVALDGAACAVDVGVEVSAGRVEPDATVDASCVMDAVADVLIRSELAYWTRMECAFMPFEVPGRMTLFPDESRSVTRNVDVDPYAEVQRKTPPSQWNPLHWGVVSKTHYVHPPLLPSCSCFS